MFGPINRLGKYFSEDEYKYTVENIREYMSSTDTNITIFIVDKLQSTVDDLYGEAKSDEVVIKKEIKIPAIINLTEKSNESYVSSTGALRHEEEGNILVTVLSEDLKDMDADVSYGDYLGIQITEDKWAYYEVADDSKLLGQNKLSIMGYRYIWRKLIGIPVEATQFNG